MRTRTAIGAVILGTTLLGAVIARTALQTPSIRSVDEKVLREYAGVYQWGPELDAFVYVQMWNEVIDNRLVAFDESGEASTLYPTDPAPDRFFAGAIAAAPASIESRIEFQRDANGKVTSLTWRRDGVAPRIARRVEIERQEDVRFSNGGVQLAGMLLSPLARAKQRHPAIILVHGSGPLNREWMLPYARFLIRHGIAVLSYDKRGVGESKGDWKTSSLDDLTGDVVAAFNYLKTRDDIDHTQIGLLGVSQAGWIMPLAAVRAKDIAFLVSVSGAGVPVSETTIDQTRNELTAGGMRSEVVEQFVGIMKLQYEYARTGSGWDEYIAARQKLAARMGPPPATFPASQDHPQWDVIRKMYLYDPTPTLRQLQTPVLALFGELDNNIVAEKNKAAWETALKAAGNRDYTLRILPKANHLQLEAKLGTNAESPSLRRFVPAYFTTVREWLAARVRIASPSR
jgi:pimeloyl-ACP methyl ester carboxylesterase